VGAVAKAAGRSQVGAGAVLFEVDGDVVVSQTVDEPDEDEADELRSVLHCVAFWVLGVADGAQSRVDCGEDLGLCLAALRANRRRPSRDEELSTRLRRSRGLP
jgi:hypothetical protein